LLKLPLRSPVGDITGDTLRTLAGGETERSDGSELTLLMLAALATLWNEPIIEPSADPIVDPGTESATGRAACATRAPRAEVRILLGSGLCAVDATEAVGNECVTEDANVRLVDCVGKNRFGACTMLMETDSVARASFHSSSDVVLDVLYSDCLYRVIKAFGMKKPCGGP
jgi:hypothetical protein